MDQKLIREIEIVNERGLHARASGALSQLSETFESDAYVYFDGEYADARSIMDLLTLAATRGSVVRVEVSGADAVEMLDAMEALIADKFGEDR